jgi:4-hydroxy-tetrahydrodipicolinate synthase
MNADFYLGCGVHEVTILGMMGEAPALTADETRAFIQHVLRRVAGQVPVVVGASSPGLRAITAVARISMEAGAAGVMIAPTPGLRTEEQIDGYYAAVFAELGRSIPVCLRDYHRRPGVYLSVPTLYRLVDRFPNS